MAESLPAHWPFGVPAEDSSSNSASSSSSLSSHNAPDATSAAVEEESEEEKSEESSGEGPIPASSISVQEDDMAQHAVDALCHADQLNRAQTFRIVPSKSRSSTARSAGSSGSGRMWGGDRGGISERELEEGRGGGGIGCDEKV